MISKLTLEEFPVTQEQAREALQLLAKQLHARYRSFFTLILVLPQSLWFGKVLEELLEQDGAHPLTVALGLMPVRKDDGSRSFVVIEPPSEHAVRNRPCVLFDAQGGWGITVQAARFVRGMRPSSIEIASFISHGPAPEWVNPDYVAFEVPSDLVVSGLGLGYTQDAMTGAALVAEKLEQGVSRGTEEAASEVGPAEASQ